MRVCVCVCVCLSLRVCVRARARVCVCVRVRASVCLLRFYIFKYFFARVLKSPSPFVGGELGHCRLELDVAARGRVTMQNTL